MAGTMAELRLWLRPPRNLLVVFLLVMFLPAATLVFLGVRLLEQDTHTRRNSPMFWLPSSGCRRSSASWRWWCLCC